MFEQAFKNIDDILWKEDGCTTELDYTEQTSWLLFLKYLDGLEQDKATEARLGGKKYEWISGKYWVNNHAHILKFEEMATQRYVEFYLESIKLDEFITGAAQPKLNQKALNSIPIPNPQSVNARKAVVDRLECMAGECKKIGAIFERKLAALDELKQSLLHQAFSGAL